MTVNDHIYRSIAEWVLKQGFAPEYEDNIVTHWISSSSIYLGLYYHKYMIMLKMKTVLK